jgi:GNAT superfamily N-acetyltransferase
VRRRNPIAPQAGSPLVYHHGYPVFRLAFVDPSAPEPTSPQAYFTETTRTIREGANGRPLKKPRVEVTPGAGPGIVAFVDYHLLPGTGKNGATEAVYIDYVAARSDQRGLGHARALLAELYREHRHAAWIDWGRVMHPAMEKLLAHYQTLEGRGDAPRTYGKLV